MKTISAVLFGSGTFLFILAFLHISIDDGHSSHEKNSSSGEKSASELNLENTFRTIEEEDIEINMFNTLEQTRLEELLQSKQELEQEDRYIVKYKEGSIIYSHRIESADLNESDGGNRKLQHLDKNETERRLYTAHAYNFLREDYLEIIHGQRIQAALWELHPDVEYVERDSKMYLMQNGQGTEIRPYGLLHSQALKVSDEYVGNRKVCIVDTGYDRSHPDLPSGDSVTGSSASKKVPWYEDENGHGTHIAGIIGGVGNNGRGVMGVIRNGKLKLHIVRVFDDKKKWVWKSRMIAAVEECAKNDSNIISLSIGSSKPTKFEAKVYERLLEKENILVIAAGGNSGDSTYSYPSSYEHVMSVAAVNASGRKAKFSSFNDKVDIAAAGVNVYSTLPNNRYGFMSGTSFSSPYIVGAAALIWSFDTSKSAKDVWNALLATANDKGEPGYDEKFGYGTVNTLEAAKMFGYQPSCTDTPVNWSLNLLTSSVNCDWFYRNENFCSWFGGEDYLGTIGQMGSIACCVCNGGTIIAADNIVEVCKDDAEWYDSDGERFNCEWYSKKNTRCSKFGRSFRNFGKTASEACCTCKE